MCRRGMHGAFALLALLLAVLDGCNDSVPPASRFLIDNPDGAIQDVIVDVGADEDSDAFVLPETISDAPDVAVDAEGDADVADGSEIAGDADAPAEVDAADVVDAAEDGSDAVEVADGTLSDGDAIGLTDASTETATGDALPGDVMGSDAPAEDVIVPIVGAVGFVEPPSDAVAGVVLTPAIQVGLLDSDTGDPILTGASAAVTLTIGDGPPGATLGGVTTVVTTVGPDGSYATFSNVSLDKAGTYTLIASAPGYGKITSSTFTIFAAKAAKLAFVVQPVGGSAGAALAPTVQVGIQDAFGNPIVAATTTVAIKVGSGPIAAKLSGTGIADAVDGIAAFDTLILTKAGAGYTLVAFTDGLLSATSAEFTVVPGAPAQIGFLTQPADSVAGTPFSPSVKLLLKDAYGNKLTTATDTVTLALGANAGGATLLGKTAVVAVAGVANFADLAVDKARVDPYTIVATAPGFGSATSPSFHIKAGDAAGLAFSVQPQSAVAGSPIAVEVTVVDGFGNKVETASPTIELSLGSNPGGAALTGSISAQAQNGVAVFSDIRLDKIGLGYQVKATAINLNDGLSTPFDINAGAATHLALTGQPVNTVAGLPIFVTVEVQDEFGNLVADSAATVQLTVATNPGGSSVGGPTALQAVGGRVVFTDLALDRVGVGYSFALAANGLTGTISDAFSILVGPPAKMAFLAQPSDIVAGAPIQPALQVVLQDAFGNTLETSSAPVTLSLGANAGAGTLLGGLTVNAQNGQATWEGISLDRSGTGYTLVATAAGFGTVESALFSVHFATAAGLVFAVQPLSALAGAPIAPEVEVRIQDAYGNTVADATDVVSIALGTNPPGANLNGVTNAKAVAGIAHFADLRIDKVGAGYTLQATAAQLQAATSQAFPVIAGGPSKLAITTQPGLMHAGVALDPPLVVAVLDTNGNLVKDATTEVTLAIGSNPGGGSLLGVSKVHAVAGVATFTDVRLDRAEVGYTLIASGASVSSDTSVPFTVEAGAAARLAFESTPTPGTAGTALQSFSVAVVDAFGNPVTNTQVPVTISASPASVVSGTASVNTVSGVAVFSDIVLTHAASATSLVASAAGLNSATSAVFGVDPGPSARLTFGDQPQTTTAGTAISPAFTVVVEDAYGNPTAASGLAITLGIGANPSGASLLGSATVQTVNGIAAFSDISLDKVGSQYTLVAASGSLEGTTSAPFDVTFTLPTALAIVTDASTVQAGAAMNPPIQVAVIDDFGNVVDGVSLSVTLTFASNPGGATILAGASAPAVNGIATFNALRLDHAGTGYTLIATVNNLKSATSQPFDIVAGAKNQLGILTQATAGVAGSPLSPGLLVEVQDAYGNRIYGANDVITLQLGPPNSGATLTGAPAIAAVDGRLTYDSLTIDKSGSNFTLTASADAMTAAVSAPIAIVAAGPYALSFKVQPSDVAAGAAVAPSVEVQVLDAYGNAVTAATNTVALQIADNPSAGALLGTTSVAASSGVASFSNIRIDKRGVGYSLSAQSDGLLSATSASFNVDHGLGTLLVLKTQPTSGVAGAPLQPGIQVAVYDAYGNPATSEIHTITLGLAQAPTGGALLGIVTADTSNGVAQFDAAYIEHAGVSYVLSAASAGLTSAESSAFDIATGAATTLHFVVEPGASVAGVPINPAVQVAVQDAFGNTVVDAAPNIGIDLGVNPTGALLSGTKSAKASKGSVTFANLTLDKVGSGYTLVAQATDLSPATSAAFDVDVSGDQRLVFTVDPANGVAGNVLNPSVQVTVKDALGNVATGVTAPISLTIGNNPGDAVLGGTVQVVPVNGVATFNNLTLDKTGKGYTLVATAPSITAGVSVPFDVDPNAATRLAFATQPSNVASGATFAPAVQVAVEDDYGNVVPAATATVALALAPANTGATVAGAVSVAAVNGIATFPGISVDKAGAGYSFVATANSLTQAASSTFQVSAGAPSRLVITAQPHNLVAGAAVSPAVVVSVVDAAGNVVPSAVNPVSLTIASGPASAALTGVTTVPATAGIASFGGLVLTRTGTYTLTASSGTLTAAITTAFDVAPAIASKLVFAGQPSQTTAGVVISPAMSVIVQDAYGNTVTGSSAIVTLAIANNPGSATLLSGSGANAANGIATFGNTALDRSGSGYTLNASASGLTGATSAPFNVLPAIADHLTFVAQPSNALAGAALSPVVQVVVQDAFGNLVTTASQSISLALSGNTTGATILTGGSASVVSGTASFANISIDRVGSGYSLVASAPGLTSAASATFAITPGAANRLVFSAQPSATVAGVAISPAVAVTIQDAWGNTVTSSSATVTIAIANNAGGGTLSGVLSGAAVSGVATFNNLRIDRSAAGYTLLASSGSLTTATSSAFAVNFAGAAKLAFLVQPTNGTAGTALNPAVKVSVQDAYGNAVTSAANTIVLSIGTGPAGATYSANVDAAAGVATFSNVVLTKQGAGYTLAAASNSLTGATSSAFSVTFGIATQLAFAVQPSDAVAGSPVTPVVKVNVLDAYDNLVTSANNTITIAIGTNPGGATMTPQNASPVGGVASFASISLDKVGSGYTLSATGSQLTSASSDAFAISPAAASRLAFSDQPSSGVAGANLATFHVAVQDAFGNAVPSATPLVTLSLSTNPGGASLLSGATATAASGVATFSAVSLDKAASGYRLTAGATNLSGATSDAFAITAGSSSALAFTQQPSDVAAGVAMSAVKVAIQDAWGNTVLTATDSITLGLTTKPGGTVNLSGAKIAAVGGIATFDAITLDKVGTPYRFTATTAGGLSSPQSNAFTVNPAAASNVVFSVQPSNVVAGAIMGQVKVNIQDAFGNIVTGGSPIVQLTVANNVGGAVILTGSSATAVGGTATFNNISLDKAGIGYTLAASSSGLSGDTSTSFNVSVGSANKLAFSVQPSDVAAGKVMTAPQVVVQDAYGNLVSTATPSVALTLAVNPASASILTGASTTGVGGVATFSNVTLDKAGTGFKLSAASSGLTSATSAAFVVTAGDAAKLAFTAQPSTTAAGANIAAVDVGIRDAYDNPVSTSTATVALTLAPAVSGGTLAGTTSLAAVGGVAHFADLHINKVGSGYTLGATSASLTGATSSAFAITPGNAATLAFSTQPSTVAAGVAIAPSVVVAVQDAYGNAVPTATPTISLALAANPGSAALLDAITVAAVGGIATFDSVRLDKVGTGYTLAASSANLTGATSSSFDVTWGTAAKLAFGVQPASAVANVAWPSATVIVQDTYGNTVGNATTSVTVDFSVNPSSASLLGTATVNAASGVATFSGLRIQKAGVGYKLSAAASTLTGTVSSAFDITFGAASKLAFTKQPTNTTSGAILNPAVEVTILDAFDNKMTSATSGVQLSIQNNPGSAALSGTASVSAIGGAATFSDLSLDKVGTGYTLLASSGALTTATSSSFNVAVGNNKKLVFTTQPVSGTAGQSLANVVVSVQDGGGNLDTASTASITLAIGTNPGSSTLSGTKTVSAVGGVATFTGLGLNKSGAGYTLAATAAGITSGVSSAFSISAGVAAKLVFLNQPAVSVAAGAAIVQSGGQAVQVAIEDANDNIVTASSAAIVASLDANASGSVLGGVTSVNAVNGVVTFSAIGVAKVGTALRLAATGGGSTVYSGNFDVVPATAAKLAFSVQPSKVAAGAAISPSVKVDVQDTYGNIVTSSSASITLGIDTGPVGATVSGNTATATNGTATFSGVSLTKASTGYKLAATSGTLTATTSGAFDVDPAAPTNLAYQVAPSAVISGTAMSPAVVVAVRDDYGNTVTTSTASISLGLGQSPVGAALTGGSSTAASAGVATFSNVKLDKSGTYTITASTTGALTAVTSGTFQVSAGAPSALTSTLTASPNSGVADGVSVVTLTATIKDANGNPLSDRLVTFTSSGTGNTLPSGAVATNASGQATNTLVSTKAETKTLSALLSGTTYALNSITFVAGAANATYSTLSPSVSTVTADGASTTTLTATIRDINNNLVSGQNVTLTSSGNGNTFTPSTGTTNASGQFTATFSSTKAETKTVSVSTGVNTYASTTVTFTAGAANAGASSISASPASVTADGVASATVTALVKDANGNPVAGQLVTFASTGSANTFTPTSGTTNAAGQVTSALTSTKAEIKTVSFLIGGTSVATTATFVAGTPVAATSAISASSSSATADGASPITFTMTVNDAYGNPVSGQTVTIVATGSFNAFSSPIAATNAAGQTTAALTSTVAEPKTVTFRVGGIDYKSTNVTFVAGPPAVATSYVSAPITSATADNATTLSISALIRDANGNPVSAATVAFACTGGPNTLSVAGGTTDNNGQITTTLKSGKAEAKTVTATVGGTTFGSVNVTFVPGLPSTTTSSITPSSSSVVADGASFTTFTIVVKDAYSNPISGKAVSLVTTGSGGVITGPTGTTNSSGTITATMTSTKAETKTVNIRVDGVDYNSTTVTFVPGVPASSQITLVASPSTATADGVSAITITATVKDVNGNPISGQAVSLSVNGSNNTVSVMANTDASGVSTGTVKSATAEAKVVSLIIGGTSYKTCGATFTAGTAAATYSTIMGSPSNVVADGTQMTITVTVRDANNNLVSGQAVTLTAGGSGNTFGGASGATNASGQYVTTLSTTVAESKLIAFQVGGVTFKSTSVTFVAGAPVLSNCLFTPSAASATADGTSAITFTTTVRDLYSNPVSGQTVTLSASPTTGITAGNITQGAATDASGVSTGSITCTKAEAKTITSTIGAIGSKTSSVSYTVGPVSALASSISGSPANVVADGTSVMTFTVTVRDAQGNPISGKSVSVNSSGSGDTFTSATGTTNASGQYTSASMVSIKAESKTISFIADSTTYSSTTVTFVAGAPSSSTSTIVASPGIGVADGTSAVTFTVTVKDANGNPVSGASVGLVSSGSNNAFGANAVSDATGRANVTMTTTTAETKVVQFKIGATTYTPSVSVSYVAGSPATTFSTLTASAGAIANNTNGTMLAATIRDANNNLVSGATVVFSATGSNNTFTPANATATTNSSGVAVAVLDSTKAETKTVTAKIGSTTYGTASVQFVAGSPSTTMSTVTASPNPGTADGTQSTITVTINDAYGNPVSGQTVALNTTTPTGNTWTNVTTVTDAAGQVSGKLATTKAETKVITAKIGVTQYGSTLNVVFNPGAVSASVSTFTCTPSTATANGTSGIVCTVTLKDANSNLISGVTPTMSATGSANTFTQPGATAIGTGVATGTIYSTKAEAKTVSATASGVTITQTSSVTFTAGTISATTATLVASPTTNYADNATTSTLTFTALDVNSNPISGQAVTFAITSGTGGTLGASGSTNSSGVLTTTLKASTNNTITVQATATTVIKTASVVFLPAKPVISSTTTPSTMSGCASLTTTIQQAQSMPVDLLVEYSTDGVNYSRATQASTGNAGVSGISTSVAGVSHTFGWNTSADLRRTTNSALYIRRTPSVTTSAGTSTGTASVVSPRTVANGLSLSAGVGTIVDTAPIGVATGDMNLDGFPDAVVANSTTKSISVLLGGSTGTFTLKGSYTTTKSVENPIIADFNGDGKPDVACGNTGNAGSTVIMGVGDGSLNTATIQYVQLVNQGRAVAAGDLDRDGDIDLIVTRHATGTTYVVLLNPGTGTFPASGTLYGSGTNVASIALGDMNEDGKLDMVLGSDSLFVGNVSVLNGNGDGTFSGQVDYDAGGSATYVTSIAIADVNQDGHLDIVSGMSTGKIQVLPGNGNGTYDAPVATNPGIGGGAAYGLSLVDLDGDGKLDATFASIGAAAVGVCVGDGAGNFTTCTSVAMNTAGGVVPSGAAVADFNKDGRLDIVATDSAGVTTTTKGVSLILNATPYDCERSIGGTMDTLVAAATAVATADFNGDGKPDVAVVSNASTGPLTILIGSGNGAFTTLSSTTLAAGSTPAGIATGDYDADGKADLAISNFGSTVSNVLVYKGGGDGTFTLAATITGATQPRDVAFGTFNSTAGLDIAIVTSGNLYVASGNGAGTFTLGTAQTATGFTAASRLRAFDAGGDAYTDLIAVYTTGTSETLALGSASGTFTIASSAVGTGGGYFPTTGDLNADGFADSVVSHGAYVSVRAGHGDGTFGTAATYNSGISTGINYSVVTGDFTGDGKIDVAVGNTNASLTSFIAILAGDGAGALGTAVTYPVPKLPNYLVTMDANGDGRLDIGYAAQTAGTFGVLLSSGSTAMQSGAQSTVSAAFSVSPADFDHNGVLDVAVSTYSTNVLYTAFSPTTSVTPTTTTNGSQTGSGGTCTADFNRDGNMDVVVVSQAVTTNVGMYLGSATGTFTTSAPSLTGLGSSYAVAAGDFDLDGKMDVVVTNDGATDYILVATGDGLGGLGTHTASLSNATGSSNPRGIVVFDLDNDGDLDIASANNSGAVYSYTNTTSPRGGSVAPSFTVSNLGAPTTSAFGISAGDLNRDGKVDFVVCGNGSTGAIGVYTNTGSGFTLASQSIGAYLNGIQLVDFDGDGDLDVVALSGLYGYFAVGYNDGAGAISGWRYFGGAALGSQTNVPLATGDFNSDGIPDFATANYTANSISVLTGR